MKKLLFAVILVVLYLLLIAGCNRSTQYDVSSFKADSSLPYASNSTNGSIPTEQSSSEPDTNFGEDIFGDGEPSGYPKTTTDKSGSSESATASAAPKTSITSTETSVTTSVAADSTVSTSQGNPSTQSKASASEDEYTRRY